MLSSICLIILGLVLLYQWYKRTLHFCYFSSRGIPGPQPSFWTGNLKEIRGGPEPMTVMGAWEKEFGLIYGYFAGKRPMLVISDLEVVRNVLVKNSDNFLDRPHLVVRTDPVPNTLVGLRGQDWKRVRSHLAPIFSSARMRLLYDSMLSCVSKMIATLDEKVETKVDVWKLYQGLSCDVISNCALSMTTKPGDDTFLKAIRGFLDNAMNPFIWMSLCFPIVARAAEILIPIFGISHQMTRTIVGHVAQSVTAWRQEGLTENKNGVSVLHQMLSLGKLTESEIMANLWVFILGGFETTSAALTFATYLIAKHPEVQEKLVSEIHHVIRDAETPTFDQIQKLPYLNQVILECLRLYPPVATFTTRHVQNEMPLGALTIPIGCNIQIPLWQIHRDSKMWFKPEEFRPERFASENDQNHPMAYIPFGAGPRTCIGSKFALLEIKLALALVLKNFRITCTEEEGPKLLVQTVAVIPAGPVNLVFSKRNNNYHSVT